MNKRIKAKLSQYANLFIFVLLILSAIFSCAQNNKENLILQKPIIDSLSWSNGPRSVTRFYNKDTFRFDFLMDSKQLTDTSGYQGNVFLILPKRHDDKRYKSTTLKRINRKRK